MVTMIKGVLPTRQGKGSVYIPYAPWDCHICLYIDPPNHHPWPFLGSPMAVPWSVWGSSKVFFQESSVTDSNHGRGQECRRAANGLRSSTVQDLTLAASLSQSRASTNMAAGGPLVTSVRPLVPAIASRTPPPNLTRPTQGTCVSTRMTELT